MFYSQKLKQIDKASRDEKHNYSVTASSSADSTCSEKRKKARGDRESSDQQSSDQTSSVLRTDESEYYEAYHMAKVWAGKLRRLSRSQKLYAEKAIHDILFEAQLGNLHKSSVKINVRVNYIKRSPSVTSHSHTSCTSKSSDSTPLCGSLLERSHSDQVEAVSSEVLISESYPLENALLSSESRPENTITSKQKLSKASANGVHTRNQTFIVAASPKTVRKGSSDTQSRQSLPLDEENESSLGVNIISNAATNTPDCILKQLSRYIRDCYDNCKNYLPPATQL